MLVLEILLAKSSAGLVPVDMHASDYLHKIKMGAELIAEVRQPRNPQFHRKFMSLLRVGFEYWEPGEVSSKHGKPEKNFDQFREDVTILAGFFYPVIRANGDVRIKAKSISFASMDEEEFSRLYQTVLTVLFERVLVGMTDADIDRIQNHLLSYA